MLEGYRGHCGNIKGEKEGTPTWDNTYQMKLHFSYQQIKEHRHSKTKGK